MLHNFKQLEVIAKERGFNAVGSFNLHCIEMLPAYFEAAMDTNSPLMIQISTGTAQYLGYDLLVASIVALAKEHDVPTCLHLDHCSNIDDIKLAIDKGFTSVMYDGSHLPLAENIANTNIIIDYAHPKNVSVEAELGAIGGAEDGKQVADEDIAFTKVSDALEFVEKSKVDMLAVSIGTVHGSYTAKTNIQHDLLIELAEKTKMSLVLHGGTGVSDEDMRFVVRNGMDKVNVGTEMNVQWVKQCQDTHASGKVNDSVRKFFIPARSAVRQVIAEKIRLFQ
ncbi:class II fructose-bisphosphate aldolase [Vibrio methylphosphonaticus]|uniref:class II fructose-bisphosphate aldolase n=1 Tax=Vibrio methylphosphonaticus TaxID=2946866 RepID=UPI00202A6A3E|nr:class II fructose-bisphosphate aldolase [Vibrio methylphosphonaticus]MCL9776848.1 class II fructose-bisphosphate aldolase [Vibrio methylphosphonaticus]